MSNQNSEAIVLSTVDTNRTGNVTKINPNETDNVHFSICQAPKQPNIETIA